MSLNFPLPSFLVQKLRGRIVRHVNVGTAGIVKVRPHDAHAVVAAGVADSRALGHIRERSVAIVVEQRIARALQTPRTALHVDAAIFAVGRLAETGKIVEMEIDVIGDHQIDESVTVVIAKCRAR